MGISAWQLALVVLVLILLFGRGRIPTLMTDIAEGIKGFKQGIKEEENSGTTTASQKDNHSTQTPSN